MLKMDSLFLVFENFHRPILKNIHLEVHSGDFIVLIGGNGSGKSSLLKQINGLYKPTSGSIDFEGKPHQNKSLEEISKDVSTLTQDLTLSTFSSLSILENLELACYRAGQGLPGEKELEVHLDMFHPELKKHLHTQTEKLSGGQRQTLALAMALLHSPKLLLLDEHTSALDPKTGHKVMELTAKVIQEHQITTIMITHELEDALAYGNRLIALKEGELIFEASGEDKKRLTKEDLLHLCF